MSMDYKNTILICLIEVISIKKVAYEVSISKMEKVSEEERAENSTPNHEEGAV